MDGYLIIRWTIRLAMLLYAVALLGQLQYGVSRKWRGWWTAAWA